MIVSYEDYLWPVKNKKWSNYNLTLHIFEKLGIVDCKHSYNIDIIESVVSKHTDLLDKELHVKT